jgi:transcriptional regulator with XRE-family HTH domain
MAHFEHNLKKLRKAKGLTQSELSAKLGINRATLASYEEGRAEPKFENLILIATYLNCGLDELLRAPLKSNEHRSEHLEFKRKLLQVLPIIVDADDNERISLVKQKATAGYLRGHQDAEFIEQLPSFSLPFDDTSQGTFRAFEIEGNSMHPIPSGSFIIAQYEDYWKSIKDESPYIVVSNNEGITYKRISIDLRKEILYLKADHPDYESYSLPLYDVQELWKAVGYISFNLDKIDKEQVKLDDLSRMFAQLKNEVQSLKSAEGK